MSVTREELWTAQNCAAGRAWAYAEQVGAPDPPAVVGEAVFGVAVALRTWEPARAAFATWAYLQADRRMRDEARRQSSHGLRGLPPERKRRPLSLDVPTVAGRAPAVPDAAGAVVVGVWLEGLLARLTPMQREVALLVWGDGLRVVDAAGVLGITADAAESRMFDAVRRLRRLPCSAFGLEW